MRILLLVIGKTTDKTIHKLTEKYIKRLTHYSSFKMEVIPELKIRKNLSHEEQKNKEGEAILKKIKASDEVILLDENGKEFSSVKFSKWMQKQMISGKKQLVFIIGGPFGFSDIIYNRANQKIALSKMTFSHEMIRPFFVEQLYRGFTILKNEPYHHE